MPRLWTMIFELKEKKDKELSYIYNKAMKELDEFFKLNWKINTPKIVILKTRREIDKFKKEKTPNWLVGWADGNVIYLLDRKDYEKESSHKYSEESYYRLLKHELCHLFFEHISRANTMDQFIWFNEGVAGFLSEQYKESTKPERFLKFLNQYSNWEGKAYGESSYAVKLLVDKFGKQKLLKFIKNLRKVNSERDFKVLFKKIYRFNLNYENMNKLLK